MSQNQSLDRKIMDKDYLNQALTIAKTRQGFCAPNPAVGAIVVKEGKVLSTGAHQGCGEAHAEVAAMQVLTPEEKRGATLYVTLEPCCHWGKTPPCTDQIIEAGIQRLVYAFEDPNPAVSGKGVENLRAHGVLCEFCPIEDITLFYRAYAHWQQHKRPWLTAKIAMTLDGKIANADGSPKKLTGAKLDALTHQYRRDTDAILTTVRTVIQDNPALNARGEQRDVVAKDIFCIDPRLEFPLDAQCIDTAKSLILFHLAQVTEEQKKPYIEKGIRLIEVPAQGSHCDLQAVIDYLGEIGKHHCWVEVGGRLLESLTEGEHCQEILLFISTQVLSSEGLTAFSHKIDFRQGYSVHWQSLGDEAYCQLLKGG